MTRIDRKKGVVYKAVCRVAGVPTESATFDKKSDARLWHDKTMAKMRERKTRKFVVDRKLTLGDLIERYIREKLPQKAVKTAKHDKQRLSFWLVSSGHIPAVEFSRDDVQDGLDMLADPENYTGRKPPGNATLNKYLKILSACLNMAVKKWEILARNPCDGVDRLPEEKSPPRYLEKWERKALMKAAKESDQPLLFDWLCIALDTGGRLGEINALTPASIDFRAEMLYYLHEPEKGRGTKTKKSRGIPLTPLALAAAKRLCAGRARDELLFSSPGNPSKPIDMKRSHQTAVRRAGIGHFRRHDCRHDFCSQLTMQGVHVVHIRDLSGHDSIEALEIYAHLSVREKRAAIAKLPSNDLGDA